MAKANPIRFSTKYQDDETDLLYYGYRYYNASTGRWLSSDPILEEGGLNVYAFIDNDGLNFVDLHGLTDVPATIALKRKIPDKEITCCDEPTRNDGEKQLNAGYQKALDRAKYWKLKPTGPDVGGIWKPSGNATCKMSSWDVLEFLVPTPRCWQCYLEERNRYPEAEDPNDVRSDHQVVICVGYTSSGAKKEIMFDWWGHTLNSRVWSGGTPDRFRQEYRYPKRNKENDYWTKCSDNLPNQKPLPCSDFGSCRAHY
jgi:RHS repeat-associated protein